MCFKKYTIEVLQSELIVDKNKFIVSPSITFVRFHCKILAIKV